MYKVNQIPMMDMAKSTTGCCTLIDIDGWDEQTIVFDHKLFAAAETRSFLYIPLNMDAVMKDAQEKIDLAGARPDDFLILSQEVSPWKARHYFAVSKEVPGLVMTNLSGTYLTKVFEGPYKNAGKWNTQLIDYVKSKGKNPLSTYFFYTVCPNCAKAYGKNYVVGFEEIET
jgi:hypothetical protein